MKNTRIGTLLIFTIVMACILAGCTSSASYTFNIANGDEIKVSLDTADGYSLKQDQGRFYVNYGDTQILEGAFLSEEGFDEYELDGPETTIIKDEEKEDFSYFFFEKTNESATRYFYLIWVNESETAVLIGGTADQSETEAAFERLAFSQDK